MRDTIDWFSWGVGFWEGEGSLQAIHGNRTEKKYLQLVAGQKDKGPLLRLQEAFGCGSVTGPYKNGKSEVYSWRVGGEDAWSLANRMFPFLSKRRQEQILEKIAIVIESRNGDLMYWMCIPEMV